MIIRFNLDTDLPLVERVAPLLFLKERLIETPNELATIPADTIRSLATDFSNSDSILLLWQSARAQGGRSGKHAFNTRLSMQPGTLAQAMRGRGIADSSFSRQRSRNLPNLEMGSGFEEAGPAAKIRALAGNNVGRSQLERFLVSGVTLNVIRQAHESLDSVASGISCYISFCDLAGIDYSPPTSYRVRQWSAIFKPGRTFGLYVSRLKRRARF